MVLPDLVTMLCAKSSYPAPKGKSKSSSEPDRDFHEWKCCVGESSRIWSEGWRRIQRTPKKRTKERARSKNNANEEAVVRILIERCGDDHLESNNGDTSVTLHDFGIQ